MKQNLLYSIFLVFLLAICSQIYGQSRVIKGVVTSKESTLPLPGVSVFVKGTSIGTATSDLGTFSLKIPANAKILVFSFIGYQTLELPADTGNGAMR